ncbi:MAG: hypothetical protein K2F55_04315, partial [Erysipelotrichaceae bacterium]|nr:hypothetical protein [Erysipelotrichaceae bacterium]
EGDAPDTSEIGIVTGNIIVRYPDDSFHKVENVRVNVGVEINTENFSDAGFRERVSALFDKNQDGILTEAELNAVTQINVSGLTNITNLKGIEHFKKVTRIDAYNMPSLEEVDVSKNTELTTLYVYNNPNLTSINVQGASALQQLYCYGNSKLKGLDVSGNSDLRYLYIKDSDKPGTDLVWLKMGAHPNLRNDSNYFKNSTSTITIGKVEETFNLKELYPDLDLSRITNVRGADIDLTTGEVSNYQDYDQTQTITYTYRGGTIYNNSVASLTVQLSIETQALPQGKEIIVAQGQEVDPADGIANKDLLNKGATYEWEGDAPDTSEIGVVTGNIIVRYPDGSSHKVENVSVNVGIELNTKNFPDAELSAYVGSSFDRNQDEILTKAELDSVTEINVSGKPNLANLKGIEYFKNLKTLSFYNSKVRSVDFSKNTALTFINANNTPLESLDVSKNTALTTLYVYNTPLEEINVSKNAALQRLDAYDMPNLTSINVQGASALQTLYCYGNPKLKGLDVSGNSDLRTLWI